MLRVQDLRLQLAKADVSAVVAGLGLLDLTDADGAPTIRTRRLLTLVKRPADSADDEWYRAECALRFAGFYLDRGNLKEAHRLFEAIRPEVDTVSGSGGLRAFVACLDVALARRSGRLAQALVESSLEQVREDGFVWGERLILEQVAGVASR